MSIEQSSMSGGTRGRSFTGLFAPPLTFDFCLSTSIPVLTTSTCVVAWPQGDQFLGGGMWHTGPGPSYPMAFTSVLYPGRCLAVELAISWAYWKLPKGNSPRTQDPNRTFRPSELFRPGASSDSVETSSFSSSYQTLVVCLRPLHQPRCCRQRQG